MAYTEINNLKKKQEYNRISSLKKTIFSLYSIFTLINSWKNYFKLAIIFSIYYFSTKLYLARHYVDYFGPAIGLDYLFNSIFAILMVVILFSSIMSSQVSKVWYFYFSTTLLNILFVFSFANYAFFFVQAYLDKYSDYSYYSFDWQADHIEINLVLIFVIIGSTLISLFAHAALNCQWEILLGILFGFKDYLFYYATYELSIGIYSMCNLELDSLENLKKLYLQKAEKYSKFKNFKIIFISQLVLTNMFASALIIYLLEIYEFRNCYLIILLSAYAFKIVLVNAIAIIGSLRGRCQR